MSIATALNELLTAVDAGKGYAVLSYDEIGRWGVEARELLIHIGFISKSAPARSIECRGCEERCFSEVVWKTNARGELLPVIPCEVPEKQAEMGLVPVVADRLQQWECSLGSMAKFISKQLGIETTDSGNESGRIRLGMLVGHNGRRWVTLTATPLALEVNNQTAPLAELIFTDRSSIMLDETRIQHMLTQDALPTGKRYQSNTDRRESRRLATVAMYQDWRDQHFRLVKEHPTKSKAWYAVKISRMDIGKGKSPDTIRKHLK